MEIVSATEEHRVRWDEFALSHDHGWHYNLFGWKHVIEQTYGHECPYLVALDGEDVIGTLPLTVIKSRLFGKSVTSLPYLDTAGILAKDESVQAALVARAVELTRDRGADYLELRQVKQVLGDCRVDTHKVSLTISTLETVEEQWDAMSSERRNRVRKARKAGLKGTICGVERLDDFYRVWSHNMRDLGSPAHSRALFLRVFENFEGSVRLLLMEYAGQCVGAAMLIEYKDTLSVPWVSSLRKHFSIHPNDALYWEAMKAAVEHGCRQFDFGRSTENSGNHIYKKRWGALATPIFWQYFTATGNETTLGTRHSTRSFNLAVNMWKRIPVGIANYIGPGIRKSITS